MNSIELQKQIITFLRTKASRVYLEYAPTDAVFPYVIYDLPSSYAGDSDREDFVLEIDVWDNSKDTTVLETLSGSIDGNGDIFNPTGLNRKNIYVDGKLAATCYREARFMIRDEDNRINHRQLRYTIQTYLSE